MPEAQEALGDLAALDGNRCWVRREISALLNVDVRAVRLGRVKLDGCAQTLRHDICDDDGAHSRHRRAMTMTSSFGK
jgi:hypothetical protein